MNCSDCEGITVTKLMEHHEEGIIFLNWQIINIATGEEPRDICRHFLVNSECL